MGGAFCPTCGRPVGGDSRYCGVCGENLERFKQIASMADGATTEVSPTAAHGPPRTVYGVPGGVAELRAKSEPPLAEPQRSPSSPPPNASERPRSRPPVGLISSPGTESSPSGRAPAPPSLPEPGPRERRAVAPTGESTSAVPRGVIFAATAFVVVVGLFLLWPRTTAPVPDDTVQPVAQTETPPAPAPAREAPTLDVSTPTKLFTEREFVVVRGRVNAGAGVWVDGLRANLRDGVFEERVAVPAFGAQQVHVVARNPSGPPREVVIDVERVRDLRVVLRRVKYDRKLSYPKLMADLEARRGARVSYVGRVYSASVGGGAAVLQVFVDRCTLPSRCPLWVTHGAPTSLAEGRRVRIVGEVQGTERLSVRGDVMDVPHISAELVLPLGK